MKIVNITVKKVYRFNCPNCQLRLESDSSELLDMVRIINKLLYERSGHNMTKDQIIALENLQRVAMDHVRIAGAIDDAIQAIKLEMDIERPDYLRMLVKKYWYYLQDRKAAMGEDLNTRENEAWKDLLFTIPTEKES